MRSILGGVVDALRPVRAATSSTPGNSPIPYATSRGGGLGGGSGSFTEQMGTQSSVGTVFSIVNRLSTDVASVDWHMHRITGSEDDECPLDGCDAVGVQLVTSHPALVVLNSPNMFYTRQEFVETIQQHVDLTGEGWFVVSKIAGRPVEIWPVRPDRIAPIRHPKLFVAGYVYAAPDGEKIPLRTDEVVMLRMPNAMDPYRGLGPVQSVMTQIDSARYSAEWNRKFFQNSALPGGVIEMAGELEDDEWKRFQARWAESHKGVNNAHRVALIEYGGVWKQSGFTQKDMQFAELGKVSREEVREAFGIHGHMIGQAEDINLANAKAADSTYAKRLEVPRLDRWKGAFNKDFLKMFGAMGKGYAFAYCSPVPADVEEDNAVLTAKTTAARTMVEAGWYGPSVAERFGLPEMIYGNPNIDPEQQLLVDIVKAAPSLFPVIGPMLGYDVPKPDPAPAPEPVEP
jgi:HK97 family phage portal protein